MTVAVLGANLGAGHFVGSVDILDHVRRFQGFVKLGQPVPLSNLSTDANSGSRTNADDRLPVDPLGRVEGGDGIVEGRDGADVRPQPTVTPPRGAPPHLAPA